MRLQRQVDTRVDVLLLGYEYEGVQPTAGVWHGSTDWEVDMMTHLTLGQPEVGSQQLQPIPAVLRHLRPLLPGKLE